MELSTKILESIQRTNEHNVGSKAWAKFMSDELKRLQKTESDVAKLRQKIEKVKQDSDAAIKQVKNEIALVQSTCHHESTTYYPDASGNNDSTTQCDICGAEL